MVQNWLWSRISRSSDYPFSHHRQSPRLRWQAHGATGPLPYQEIMLKNLEGIIPPLVTPFTAGGVIDEAALRGQIKFMLDEGVHGVCVGGSTGEGYTLNQEDLVRLMEITTAEIAGQVPIVAGIIANSTYDAVSRAKAVAKFKPAALQLTPTYYIFKPNEDENVAYFREITTSVDIPIIIYNVIRWNILPADSLVRIMTEVPGVIGVKQSAGEIKLLADLLVRAPKGKLILTAQDALLYPTFMIGAHGSISAIPASSPRSALALWNACQTSDHATARALHDKILPFWNALMGDNMPACAKYALSLQGCPVGLVRKPMNEATSKQRERIEATLNDLLCLTPSKIKKAA